ncbi:hypothetical protein OYT88_02125 [Sporolactobacillus sp. CQH2019]|uniref:hypothetical protein n=1 Tax=Sporolactobacillus sp. CQH2019 TaxID=3023512 RepID=UPI002367A432|nr:hypothetical protein [Sporolactobacillus sp. CQH2019]MDD9147346.1 hypothetical protein [Sporolactobacillus sp. CQH2019]
MTVRVKIPNGFKTVKKNGKDTEVKQFKEYAIRENIHNVKRAYLIQKDFFDLSKKIDFDGEEANTDQIQSGITANVEALDKVENFIADVVNNENLTVDFIEENFSENDLTKASQDLINKLLHVDEKVAGVSNPKKSVSAKPSED